MVVSIYSRMKPLVTGFPSKRQRVIDKTNGVQGNLKVDMKELSMKLDVAPESMRAEIGS